MKQESRCLPFQQQLAQARISRSRLVRPLRCHASIAASACAMNPPIDHPITFARSTPRVSITCAASSASFAMSNACPLSVEPPIPRSFSRISSLEDASRSMKDGSQSALVAAKPFKIRSGCPFPIRRQTIWAPLTATVVSDSAGIRHRPQG